MATFGEIVYSVLDLMKALSDDSYYTEEHIIFLAGKYRALLLERKYNQSRNSSFRIMNDENTQRVCLSLETTAVRPAGCGGLWLKSHDTLPNTLGVFEPRVCTYNDLVFTTTQYVPRERMPYVGYNKWLKNIIYVSRSADGRVYLHSNNPQFLNLERIGIEAVYSDPEEAARKTHEFCESKNCDIMEWPFPLEADLVPQLIEMIFQELSGQRYAPEDKKNNADDNLSEIATAQRPTSPATKTTYQRAEDEQ